MTSKDELRADREALDAVLAQLGSRVRGRTARCVWHEDQNPSASILQGEQGEWRLYCHVCQRSADVLELRELAGHGLAADQLRALDDRRSRSPSMPARVPAAFHQDLAAVASLLTETIGAVEATYEYTNPSTRGVELAVFRLIGPDGRKTFRQASPCDGGWRLESPPKPWPIYNRARIAAADLVVVVEGEKCVHALHALGIVATTSPCGAGKAALADWTPLAGKAVVLWPDFDEIGKNHMADVRKILEGLSPPPQLSLVEVDALGLPPKGDCVEFIAAHGTDAVGSARTAVEQVLVTASSLGVAADVDRLFEDVIAGRRKAVAWPWPRLTALSQSLLPGTVTLVAGDPGCGKSFALLQAAACWQQQGERVAVLELEEDGAYHARRALVQRCGDARLADDAWIAGHPSETNAIRDAHRQFLRDFAPCLHVPQGMPTLRSVADWIERQARAGNRLIVVDPLTAAGYATARSWEEDLAFMMRAKVVAKDYGCSVVLAMHPRKGQRVGGGAALDDVAGGSAYIRLAQAVLWIRAHEPPRSVNVRDRVVEANRTVAILKTRNGPGNGARLAFNFQSHSLRFEELGVETRMPKPVAVAESQSRKRRRDQPPSAAEDLFSDASVGEG